VEDRACRGDILHLRVEIAVAGEAFFAVLEMGVHCGFAQIHAIDLAIEARRECAQQLLVTRAHCRNPLHRHFAVRRLVAARFSARIGILERDAALIFGVLGQIIRHSLPLQREGVVADRYPQLLV